MEPREKTYLLTGGLVPLLENRHKVKLSPETKETIRTIEHAYFAETRHLLQGRSDKDNEGIFFWNVQFIPDTEIENDLRNLVISRRGKLPILSFDDVYCTDLPNGFYSISRIVDPTNLDNAPVLGPRLGHPPLEDQVRGIAKKFGKEMEIKTNKFLK